MYIATPAEIAIEMHKSRAGDGDTVLHEYHKWGNKAKAAGTEDIIPVEWEFSNIELKKFLMRLVEKGNE